jgi:hypothetical protein
MVSAVEFQNRRLLYGGKTICGSACDMGPFVLAICAPGYSMQTDEVIIWEKGGCRV